MGCGSCCYLVVEVPVVWLPVVLLLLLYCCCSSCTQRSSYVCVADLNMYCIGKLLLLLREARLTDGGTMALWPTTPRLSIDRKVQQKTKTRKRCARLHN